MSAFNQERTPTPAKGKKLEGKKQGRFASHPSEITLDRDASLSLHEYNLRNNPDMFIKAYHKFAPTELMNDIIRHSMDLEQSFPAFGSISKDESSDERRMQILKAATKNLPQEFIHELFLNAASYGHSTTLCLLMKVTPINHQANGMQANHTLQQALRNVNKNRESIQEQFNNAYTHYLGLKKSKVKHSSAKKGLKVELISLANRLASYDKATAFLEKNPDPEKVKAKKYKDYYTNPISTLTDDTAVQIGHASSGSADLSPGSPSASPRQSSSVFMAAFARLLSPRRGQQLQESSPIPSDQPEPALVQIADKPLERRESSSISL